MNIITQEKRLRDAQNRLMNIAFGELYRVNHITKKQLETIKKIAGKENVIEVTERK